MVSTCSKEKDAYESSFSYFLKTLMKTFITLTIIVMAMTLKNRLITSDTTMFYSALYIIGATVLLTLLGTVDHYIYNNLMLGVGLALGLQMMDWRINN
tara:strand:+ start:359 stop:652 length:294 start_codon:yes stop_codon:yes gene_type:complete